MYIIVSYRQCYRKNLESVRRELSEAHAQSTQQALTALAQEKDDALTEARQTWNREKSSLKERVCESNLGLCLCNHISMPPDCLP